MSDGELSIPRGESDVFAIAGTTVRLRCERESRRGLRLARSFEPFVVADRGCDVEIAIASDDHLNPALGERLYDSKLHWRSLRMGKSTVFEFVHPPTGLLYCQTRVSPDFTRAEVRFSEFAFRELATRPSNDSFWEIPYPLDQLLLIPALARREAVLLHACGAEVAGRGFVFAGHSGDGKTTLAGLLSREGTLLLSDERIAIRKTERGFVAFGTPWPGEGNVVSNGACPLQGMFVLKKAARHALGGSSPSLAPELIARAIVPYYLPDVAERILGILAELASEVPLRELHFARAPGLTSLLREAFSPPVASKA